jgi:hypothetical protein
MLTFLIKAVTGGAVLAVLTRACSKEGSMDISMRSYDDLPADGQTHWLEMINDIVADGKETSRTYNAVSLQMHNKNDWQTSVTYRINQLYNGIRIHGAQLVINVYKAREQQMRDKATGELTGEVKSIPAKTDVSNSNIIVQDMSAIAGTEQLAGLAAKKEDLLKVAKQKTGAREGKCQPIIYVNEEQTKACLAYECEMGDTRRGNTPSRPVIVLSPEGAELARWDTIMTGGGGGIA